MPTGADVLAATVQELMPGLNETFVTDHPLMHQMVENGNIDKEQNKGPYREFTVLSGGPGTSTTVSTGSELVAGGRKQNAQKGNCYATRIIHAFDVPGKDLAEAFTPQGLAKLVKEYPVAALDDFKQEVARQFGSGNGDGVGGFLTLNADATYNPNGTALPGVFEFAARASQTDTVFGLIKEGGAGGVTGWYNQYARISAMAVDGRKKIRQAYFAAGRQGKSKGPVDLMIGDVTSFEAVLEDLDDAVRIVAVKEGDTVARQSRQGIKFNQADFWEDDAIDLTQFTTGGADTGVIYGFKTPTWNLIAFGENQQMETKGFFDMRGPIRHPTQDMWRYEYVLHAQIFCTDLRCNFVVTGGAA